MGCGVSKFDLQGEEVAAKLQPLLRRRFDELKRRRSASSMKSTNLSKKNLLKEGTEDDGSSPPHSLHENDPEESLKSKQQNPDKPTKEPKKNIPHDKVTKDKDSVKGKHEEKENKAVQPLNATLEKEMLVLKIEEAEQTKKTEKSKKTDEAEETEEEEEEEEGRLSSFDESYICGSPSFRVYCIHVVDSDSDDGKEDEVQKTSSEIFELVHPDEGTLPEIKKKGKRGRRFRRVIPKGKPRAVRNLLSVTSCYNPACSGLVNHRLPAQKAPS